MRPLLLGALVALALPEAVAQVDTTAASPAVLDTTRIRSPRTAVTRALVFPGLGQVYNREWVKAPVATALVAGAIGYAVFQQRRYLLYRRSTAYAGCLLRDGVPDGPDGGSTDPGRIAFCVDTFARYEAEWVRTGSLTFGAIEPLRERIRGQRDIGFLVVGVAYAVQALDAYVAAELSGFDVSEDLSLRLVPAPEGAALALRLGL